MNVSPHLHFLNLAIRVFSLQLFVLVPQYLCFCLPSIGYPGFRFCLYLDGFFRSTSTLVASLIL
ncbi:hypothetical protein SERLA73DRAFT_133136 [Serpula lacrymans var. lacrymans S7.3]|uniref:Uncharacterized protein n=2 Tax=Serpula lacrymans var. lacrymans TaxID=341189 RepID=F8PQI2_SERL3|nr:uncharacterized protein SERLADRAFT_383772 [Serpula lacrymans var. lacrymans S7.9]EGO02230.1 hypothetical protein SERLA73DRAFT_133136 [Serpula lacrymans var. lacrymans S7.3]EGO27947.1 hypothetical protein SERLADRAFT_383772 [Serpula lacrymans var. lacrymans S7.9]